MPSLDQWIVWVVVGLIGGSMAGAFITWDRKGFGLFKNVGLGLAGAIVGGFLFRIFEIAPEFDRVSVSLRDIVAACAGSLLVLMVLWLWRRSQDKIAID